MNNIYRVLRVILFPLVLILSVSCMQTSGGGGGSVSGQVCTANKPTFLSKFGRGSYVTEGEIGFPSAITADNSGNIYVCSRGGISKFDSDGNYVNRWQPGACAGLETDNYGNVFVVGLSKLWVYTPDGEEITEWPDDGDVAIQFTDARDVAINNNLNPARVYVVEGKNFKVKILKIEYDQTFTDITNISLIGNWGSEGTEDGQFSGPRGPYGIAVDEDTGVVYVADTEAHRIQKFDQDGNFILKWGERGNEEGKIKFPRDVEVDSDGYVYEADTDAERIQVFEPDGDFMNFIMEFQGLHNEIDGPFHPRSVAVDQNGNIYAAAAYANRIDKFKIFDEFGNRIITSIFTSKGHPATPDGDPMNYGKGSENYVDSFGWLEKDNGVFYGPKGIVIDTQNGYIYVADTSNFLVQKFNTNGNFLKSWGYSGRVWTIYNGGNEDGNFDFPTTITTDRDGNVYVVRPDSQYGGEPQIERIQKFDKNGELLDKWNHNGFIESMLGIAYNPVNGYIYVANTPRNKIQYFKVDGTYQGEFNFTAPTRLAVDRGTGDIYVVDVNNHRIHKFNQDGAFILEWGQYGRGEGEFNLGTYSGIYVDDNGYVYVADTNNRRIQVFDSNGQFILKWGKLGYDDGEFRYPQGVVVDSNGYIYVLDSGKNNVQKFCPIQ